MDAANLFIAAILGIVEGLTEFVPVSSTGHLIIAGELLGFTGPKAETFEIFIQLGAILSVVFLYLHRFKALLDFRPNQTGEFRGMNALLKIGVACLPAMVLGLAVHRFIKEYLFSSTTVAAALLIGGMVMILAERNRKPPRVTSVDKIGLRESFLIGCFQCFSLWPGMSRAATTIVGGLLSGLSRTAAAEFSFLIAVPMMAAATSLDLWKSRDHLSLSDIPFFTVGFLVSFAVGLVAVRFLMAFLSKRDLSLFGWYRIVVAAVVLLLMQ
jgi:undecaprenyl-diphosphatase